MLMLPRLTHINTEVSHENPYWRYVIDTYAMPDGKQGKYYYADSRGAVMVVPQLHEDAFVLVRQYRYLNDKESLEFPGGGVIPDFSILQNATKELLEETGYQASVLTQIGAVNPFNGVTNEICSVFHAQNLQFLAAEPEETEFMENIILSAAEIDACIRSGELWDGMSITAWMLYKVHSTS